jgi:hypothetical protein
MIIFCKICGQKFNSNRPEAEQQKDVLVQMANHLKSHQEQSVSLAIDVKNVIEAITTYLLIKDYIRIPPEEQQLLKSYHEMESCLVEIFGLSQETKN